MTGVFDHPWLGGLFGDADAATLWSPERQISHMLRFEAAFTRALGSVGTVPAATADMVAAQIETFAPDHQALRDGTERDGVVVPDLVRQLKVAISDSPNAIHTGTTSQDVIDTALALTVKEFNDLLDLRLQALIASLSDLADRFGGEELMGRTRMQAAVAITVGDRLRTWSEPLGRHRARLADIRPDVECLQLGGAAGNRATLGANGAAVAAHMADALGLNNPASARHPMRDSLGDYANLLSLISGTIGKMGQDVCLMAQQGVDEITLQGGGGSSAMPHKQNPVLAELLVTLARFNATQVGGMHHALVHEQERSGAAWALEWMILPQMAQTTARSLSAAHELGASIARLGSAA